MFLIKSNLRFLAGGEEGDLGVCAINRQTAIFVAASRGKKKSHTSVPYVTALLAPVSFATSHT